MDYRCHESDGLELGDETQKLFLNPHCNHDGLSTDLAAFMDYLLGHLSDDTYVQDLECAVKDARQHNEWRREYMTLEMKYQEKYLEGKEDGKIEEIVFNGIEDQLPKEKILQRIMKRTGDLFSFVFHRHKKLQMKILGSSHQQLPMRVTVS
ncbi:MAG: hypothetical protein ACI4HI_11685 [Lachnospiraceae bacterium]